MTEYNKIAEGYFTSTGVAKFISLPFLPDSFEIWNLTEWGTNTNHLVKSAIGFQNSAAGTAYTTISNGTANNNVTITSGGFTFIQAGTYQYGPIFTITGITQANLAVVTTSAPHGYVTGDVVLIYGTTGMLQISGQLYTVTVLSTTTFSIDVDSSGFAAAATAGFVKRLLYSNLYVPQASNITAIATGTTTTITTAINHSFVVGQEVFFVIPQVSTTAWGTTQLDTFTYNTANVVPQQAYVTSVPAANQIVVNVNSTGFTAFAFPTSAQAALGITFPQVLAIGDQNSGQLNAVTPLPIVPPAITIPGAFYANTRQGVSIGVGDGTTIMHATSDVIRWRAIYPDMILTS